VPGCPAPRVETGTEVTRVSPSCYAVRPRPFAAADSPIWVCRAPPRAIMLVMLRVIRYWLPGIVVIGGIGVMIAGGGDEDWLLGGAGIVGAGLSVWLLNLLFRVGVSGDRARDEEEDARAFFDRHGRWPDELGRHGGSGDEPEAAEPHKVRPAHARPPHQAPPRRPR
jgi:hypothetical protein